MTSKNWTFDNIPDQQGTLAIVTGSNSGVGYEAARGLSRKGAQVILAVRSTEKGDAAVNAIRAEHPSAQLQVMVLDLADLSSVRRFAETFLKQHKHLNILINNAGVMALPYRRTTDGFEMQFGTNHLGHFALTGLLMPAIAATPGARMAAVSSINHNFGRINFDDLNGERRYDRWAAYNQSKLANLLFAYEFQRRLVVNNINAIGVGCHPGFTSTNLQLVGAQMEGSGLMESAMRVLQVFGQDQPTGALPLLYAATSPDVKGGDYIGPTSMGGLYGYPAKAQSNSRSHDPEAARRLWEISEKLTDVQYQFKS
jgi:NAD(P)-dependent dehydrogenase (short-subunit alcohol dehydrogenase family)